MENKVITKKKAKDIYYMSIDFLEREVWNKREDSEVKKGLEDQDEDLLKKNILKIF